MNKENTIILILFMLMFKKLRLKKGLEFIMNNSTLKSLLQDYEQKRLNAILDLDRRKEKLYSSNSDLENIEDTLNISSLNLAKAILSTPYDTNTISNLQNKINTLKEEKKVILQKF